MGGLGGLSGRESGVLWASEIALLHGLGAGHGIVAEEGLAGVASADIADIGKGSRHATRKNRRIGVG